MFRGKQKRVPVEALLKLEVDRLRSLTAEEIALDLFRMAEPFGLDQHAMSVGGFAQCLVPGNGRLRGPLVQEFWRLIDEGAQALVRAGLFASAGWGGAGGGNVYRLSRAGREALEQGSAEEALGGQAPAS